MFWRVKLGSLLNGMSIPWFRPGVKHPNALSADDMNHLVAPLRGLVNPSVVEGDTYAAFLTESNFIIQIKKPPASTVEGTGVVTRFKVAAQAAPNDDKAAVYNDYITCIPYAGGDSVNIARPPLLQCSAVASRTIDGVAISYSYATATQRTASATGYDSQTEIVEPHYLIDDEVWAMQTGNLTGVTVGGIQLDWIDLNLDQRHWAAIPEMPPP